MKPLSELTWEIEETEQQRRVKKLKVCDFYFMNIHCVKMGEVTWNRTQTTSSYPEEEEEEEQMSAPVVQKQEAPIPKEVVKAPELPPKQEIPAPKKEEIPVPKKKETPQKEVKNIEKQKVEPKTPEAKKPENDLSAFGFTEAHMRAPSRKRPVDEVKSISIYLLIHYSHYMLAKSK